MRLTNAVKNKIIANALKQTGIHEEFAQHHAQRAEWVYKCYCHILGENQVAHLKQTVKSIREILTTAPDRTVRYDEQSIFHVHDNITLNIGGLYYSAAYNGWPYGSKISPSHPVYLITPIGNNVIPVDSPLAEEFNKLEEELKDLRRKWHNIEIQVNAALSQCTTTNQLLKVWPEAVELLPSESIPKKKQLPAIPVEKLNLLIGLPSEN